MSVSQIFYSKHQDKIGNNDELYFCICSERVIK